jgi:DNA-binding response OmpR family regulator
MKRRILVIDDDPAVLSMVEEVLAYEHFEVMALGNTHNAIEAIQQFGPDAVLLDYLIGHINGGDLCHLIKSSPKVNHIPVIIVSAYSNIFDSLGTFQSDAFIAKPFDMEDLLKTIDDCIAQSDQLPPVM